MNKSNDYILDLLASFLGKEISNEKGSCKDYLDVYNLHISDLRKIVQEDVSMSAIKYILFLTGENGDLRNTMSFLEQVVKNGKDVDVWMRDCYDAKRKKHVSTS